jgi:predicted RNA-binding protein with RPS1 domain
MKGLQVNVKIIDMKNKDSKIDLEIRKMESCKKLLLKDIRNIRKKQIQYYEDSALTNCADSGSVETSSFL